VSYHNRKSTEYELIQLSNVFPEDLTVSQLTNKLSATYAIAGVDNGPPLVSALSMTWIP